MADFDAILAEHGIRVIPTAVRGGDRETHAGATLRSLYAAHGEQHLRDVLTTIMESENNRRSLRSPIIKAVSDIHIAHGHWFEADASKWFAVFDRLNLIEMHEFAKLNGKAARAKDAMATMIFRELVAEFVTPDARMF